MRAEKYPFKRKDRVADQLRQVLAEILVRSFPHHGLEDITVTEVQITADLKSARVFYRLFHPETQAGVKKALTELTGSIRKEVGTRMRLRYTPTLRFKYDESLERGNRIETLLQSVLKESQTEDEAET